MMDFQNDLLYLSLYKKIKLTEENYQLLKKVIYKKPETQYDSYCVECENSSTFIIKNPIYVTSAPIVSAMSFSHSTKPNPPLDQKLEFNKTLENFSDLEFYCTRDNNHIMYFQFLGLGDNVIKIGQYPSIADLQLHDIKKYRSLLKDDYIEFSKAIGLYANGIGIGSYVYLRRIFENLVYKAKDEAPEDFIDDKEFLNARMDVKIKLLSEYLPEALVSSRKLYSIISKGIHELSEEECLAMFEPIKTGIEIILDEVLEKKERLKKTNQLQKFLSSTFDKLNS